MDKRNKLYLFATSLISYATVFAENDHKSFSIYCFLNNLSHAAWTSFFFATRIIGALFVGNVIYCIQALILFALVIAIESYIIHKLTKSAYLKTIQYITTINIIHAFNGLLIILLNIFKVLITYKYLSIFVLLAIRIFISYFIYTKMNPQTNKKLLTKSIIIANGLSFLFTTVVIMLFRL